MFLRNGRPPSGLAVVTGRRWGMHSNRLATALTAAGFPSQEDDEPAGHLTQWTFPQGALHAVIGVHLTDDMLTNPWIGGLTPTN